MTNFTPHCKTCRCGSVTVATQERTESENFTIDRWIGNCLKVDPERNGKIYRRHLARAFDAWCHDQGIADAPSPRALYGRLRLLGYEEIKVKGLFYFRGLDCEGRVDYKQERARLEAEEEAELEEIAAASATMGSTETEAASDVT